MRKRQSRYIRPDADKVGNLVLGPRDLDILNTVFEYRFLRTDHLTALVDGDRTSIEKRLRKLWEHRFLERSFLPLYPEPATRQAIYSLDYKGANLLMKEKGIDPKLMGHVLKHNTPNTAYVEHQLLSSNFRAALTLALEKQGKAKITFWRQDNEIRDRVEVKLPNGKNKSLPVAPDGYFCIEDERGKMYWFVEADRYTMDNRRFLNKMRAYYHWWEQKEHTKKFGIKNFRVLTITHNKAARDRRLEVTKEVKVAKIGGRDVPVGMKIFWFLSEDDYSLEKFGNVLKSIIRVAKAKEEDGHALLD